MARYSNEEYYDMLMAFGECHGQHNVAARRYAELYPNRQRHPSAAVILGAAQRLYETGNVFPNKRDTGRDRNARTLRNTEAVLRAVEQDSESSTRVIAREHDLSHSTVRRILEEEKLHAFHYTCVQHLLPQDYPSRMLFCQNFLRRADRDPTFPSRVIFSDESLFTQEGTFNSHNMHCWNEENPYVTRIRNFQIRWKLNVWAGIRGTEILGPIILPDILTGAAYLEMLRDNLPEFLEDVPLLERNKIIFQQDGAGPHNARIVTNYLNQQFPGRWMGRYGPIRWPARSPDLNPLDFFFWGYCNEQVYRTLPEDLEDLETRLRYAVWSIDEGTMQNVQANLLRRMRACVRMDGGHFEHLL